MFYCQIPLVYILSAWLYNCCHVYLGLHQTSTPAPGMGHPYFHPAMTPGPNITQEIAFSGKYNGICLYLARILRYV